MKKSFFLSAIIALFICSCATETETELTDEQKATIISEVEYQYVNAVSNLSTLDMEIWSQPWSEDNFISFSSLVNYFPTLSEFKDSVTYWFSLRESQELQIVDMNTTVLSSDLVLLTSIANWDILFKSGEQIIFRVLVTLLWNKEPNGWKIINGHESFQPITED